MYSMYCRILLRHYWPGSSNWNVCCWNIFGNRCFLLSGLFCWNIFGLWGVVLFLVSGWNLFINDRL